MESRPTADSTDLDPGASPSPGDVTDRPGPAATGGTTGLARLFRLLAAVVIGIGVIEATIGILENEWRAIALGDVGFAYGLWVVLQVRTMTAARRDIVATRVAIGTLGLIATAAALQPSMGTALAIGSLLQP